MSTNYVGVQWNVNKAMYDTILWLGIIAYIVIFMAVSGSIHSGDEALSPIILMMRATSTLAFILLTLILCIGPLARLNTRFLPLLYNRRHLGVSMFLVACVHAFLVIFFYHSFGVLNPIVSIFVSPGSFTTVADIKFQPFGFFALLILFVMAATSHDYWNKNLGAPMWKAIHMCVYLAYALIILHVAFGAMQDKAVGFLPTMLLGSVLLVGGLHITAAFKSKLACKEASGVNWINIGSWRKIENNCGISVSVDNDERIAIFRYDSNKLAAVANACKHQNGPLCEGRVMGGLITCPWHGFQYQPQDGKAPAPFSEQLATYELKLEGDCIMLNPVALGEGVARAIIEIQNVIPMSPDGAK